VGTLLLVAPSKTTYIVALTHLLYILPSVDSNIQSPGPCPELGSNERALEINMASKYGRINVAGLVIYHSAMQPDKRKVVIYARVEPSCIVGREKQTNCDSQITIDVRAY